MLVREAVAELLTLPQDHEIRNEYGDEILTRFYVAPDPEGDYVAFDAMEDDGDPE